ncbi:MAG: hypothetical protein ABSC90_00105 [Acidimicrobiales bacterium]
MDSINVSEIGGEKFHPDPGTPVVCVGAEQAEIEMVPITRVGCLEEAKHFLDEFGALAHHFLQQLPEMLLVSFAQLGAPGWQPD